MLYIVLGVVAILCFLFCFFVLARVDREEPERRRPAWQDEDADEEAEKISYRSSRRIRGVEDKSTPWKHDPEEDEEEEEEVEVYDLDEPATKRFSPVTGDKPAEKRDDPSATKKFKPVERDAPAPQKYKKSRLLRTLEICCGILFALALILLIIDIYIHSL